MKSWTGRISLMLIAMLLVAPASAVSPQLTLESAKVRLYIDKDLTGTAVARTCTTCDPIRLRVSPKMKLIDFAESDAPKPWNETLDLVGKNVGIRYFRESRQIDAIMVYETDINRLIQLHRQ